MYQTSDNYKSKIYLPSTKHLLKIFINNIEIDKKYILGCKFSQSLFNNDEFTLGSVSSKSVDLKLYKTVVPDNIENIYIVSGIAGEEVPIGYFNIEERTSEDDYTVTLKCLDNMIKFEVNYDGSTLDYPCNLMTVLTDICNKVGVELGSTSFLNADKEVTVYDNTVSARTYLSYIAEQAGGFAFIGRDGKLYIKTIGEDIAELPVQYFQDFKWGEQFKVSRVRYEDGVQLFEKGDETNNTIYINQENMYIVDQEQIDNIYNTYKDFNCYSFEGNSIIDPALDIGDLLLIDGKYVIYHGDMEYVGKFKANISSKIQAKTKEETMVRTPSQKTINRRMDSRINQVEGSITQVISEVDEQNQKVSKVTQTVDELNSKIQDIADITTFGESMYAKVELDSINESEPIQITVKPTVENISYLYPHNNLFPSNTLYPKVRTIRFTNKSLEETDKNKYIDYILPDDLLIAPDGTYDEFYLGYEEQVCQVTKRCQYNADGTVSKLDAEQITSYDYPKIELKDGDYTVELLGYTNAYLSLRLMAQNIYTTQFYTKAETNSEINQATQEVSISIDKKLSNYSTTTQMRSEINSTADAINLEVRKKVGDDEIISTINQSAEEVQINADKINIDGKAVRFKTDISVTIGPFTYEDRTKMINYLIGTGTLTQEELQRYDVNGDGKITSVDTLLVTKAITNGGYYTFSGYYEIDPYSYNKSIRIYDNNQNQFEAILSLVYNYINYLYAGGANIEGQLVVENEYGRMFTQSNNDNTRFELYTDGDITAENQITCKNLVQSSLLEKKKNFNKLENGLETVKNTDIYKYNLKSQKDTDKKHIGFVIGDNYNYSEEITSENNDGVDIYSMISVAYKAIQELAEQNEQLQNEIKELKGEK